MKDNANTTQAQSPVILMTLQMTFEVMFVLEATGRRTPNWSPNKVMGNHQSLLPQVFVYCMYALHTYMNERIQTFERARERSIAVSGFT